MTYLIGLIPLKVGTVAFPGQVGFEMDGMTWCFGLREFEAGYSGTAVITYWTMSSMPTDERRMGALGL